MSLELGTAKTGFPPAKATQAQVARTRLGFRRLGATNPPTSVADFWGTQSISPTEQVTGYFVSGGQICDVVVEPRGFFDVEPQLSNWVDGWVLASEATQRRVSQGSTLTVEPQLIVFECKVQSPNATTGLVSFPPFSEGRKELEKLRSNVDGDWVTPTLYAYENARGVVELFPDLDVPFMATDGEGGIRMAWRRGQKQVRANFGAQPGLKSYIYYESPESYAAEDLQPIKLWNRLRWLDS
jgi:hypothetical protein